MLSSQIAIASQTSICPSSSLASSSAKLRSAIHLSRKYQPGQQQTRAFRFNLWSSYLDPSFQRELQRRNRVAKHKYIDSLNRKLSWDGFLPDYGRRAGLKGFMCGAWNSRDQRPGGRWVNAEALDQLSELSRTAFDELLHISRNPNFSTEGSINNNTNGSQSQKPLKTSDSIYPGHFDRIWMKHFRLRKHWQGKHLYENEEPTSKSQEYEIDPITNRKVYKNPTADTTKSVYQPTNTHKNLDRHLSQLGNFDPLSELQNSRALENSTSQSSAKEKSERIVQKETPFHALNRSDSFPNHARKSNVKSFNKVDPVQEGLKKYDYKASYDQPFMAYEPDGKFPFEETPDQVDEGLKAYDSKVSYNKPFKAYEPDGKAPSQEKPDPLQDALKAYDAKVSYDKPFMAYEPDGQVPVQETPDLVQEGLRKYDAKVSYHEPFTAYEPDGQIPEEEAKDLVEDGLNRYDTQHSYGPVYHNEPDGKPQELDSVADSLKIYDEQNPYGPVYNNEPDGIPADSVQEGLRDFDSRTDYGSGRPSWQSRVRRPIFNIVKDSSQSDKAENLDSLRASDIRAASGIVKNSKKFKECTQTASEENEDMKLAQSPIQGMIGNTPIAAIVSKGAKDIIERSSTHKQQITGNFVRDFPEDFKATWVPGQNETGSLVPAINDTSKVLLQDNQDQVESKIQKAEKEYVDGLASEKSFSRIKDTPRLQTSLNRTVTHSSKAKSSTEANKAEATLSSKGYAESVLQQGEGDLSTSISSYGSSGSVKSPGEVKAITQNQQPENQNKQSLVAQIRSIYEDAYGAISPDHRQVPKTIGVEKAVEYESSLKPAKEPTFYKILAYDPTMQSIDIAVTSSIVTDTTSALTPAEVLLRLSNPAKFFPHFAPLQSQGYEIVSGSGDVLVFRKVRPSLATSIKNQPENDLERNTNYSRNPIDGIGGSPVAATGNFASPTGFVNHDMPTRPKPNFKSNVDVRREEPVFSGRPNWEDETLKKKSRGKGKRILVGALGVGACSYAVGVVAEFFKTGGIDGIGPQGF